MRGGVTAEFLNPSQERNFRLPEYERRLSMTPVIESVVIKSVELANRIRLPFVEQGDAAGAPVVLLHGYSDSWHSYERVLPHLPPSLRAFAVTQRGHGDATRPRTGYRTEDLAADVAAFLAALGIDSAVIVGHSMGSTVAQQFACDFPERTRGIVLVGAFATMKDNPDVMGLQEAVAQLEDPVDAEFVREFQQSTLARPVPPDFFETVQRESLKMPARVWKAALADLIESDFSARLETIK